uniref:hypothetical protein n=1 Tax=Stenotrophomonas maltophilia TaxID=40324 RepID=UPI003CCFF49D
PPAGGQDHGQGALAELQWVAEGEADGRRLLFRGTEDGPSAEMIVHDYRFARRLMLDGDLGFAEAYIRGEWD